jgi:hypothetical protein
MDGRRDFVAVYGDGLGSSDLDGNQPGAHWLSPALVVCGKTPLVVILIPPCGRESLLIQKNA